MVDINDCRIGTNISTNKQRVFRTRRLEIRSRALMKVWMSELKVLVGTLLRGSTRTIYNMFGMSL